MSSKRRSGKSSGNPAGKPPKPPTRPPSQPEDEGAGVVWVRTEPTVDGSGYVVTLEASDDVAVTLTPDVALRHAQGVLAAAHRAAYDAAVLRQMTQKFNFALSDAGKLAMELRSDRPPLDPTDTAPLWLEPGVKLDLKPFLIVHINGERVGQWDVDQAERHAHIVLAAVGVADLDSGYYRMLRSTGVEEPQARAAVEDLVNFRDLP